MGAMLCCIRSSLRTGCHCHVRYPPDHVERAGLIHKFGDSSLHDYAARDSGGLAETEVQAELKSPQYESER